MALSVVVSQSRASNISIDALKNISPTVEYFGWDTKGDAETALSIDAAREHFGECANLIRIPILPNAAFENGGIDVTQYQKYVQCVHNALAVNPKAKVFASLKLKGADTFPQWMNGTSTGRIFGHVVRKPDASRYGNAVVNYIQFLQQNHIALDYLGLNNEVEHALDPELYVRVAEIVRHACVARNIPPPFSSFQFVGAECFSLSGSVEYAERLKYQPGLVQILGSHCYYGHKGDGPDNWLKLAHVMQVPIWFTEVHMNRGAVIAEAIRSMELIFNAIERGVTGFIWWGNGGGNTIGHTIKRELTNSMVGGRLVQTTPDFMSECNGETMAQAVRIGDRLILWFACRGKDPFVDVRIAGKTVSKIVGSTWWCGENEEITPANSGRLDLKLSPDGSVLSIVSPPKDSVAMVTLDLK